jgi:hypothetical protein
MRGLLSFTAAPILAIVLAMGCAPYDPELGDKPFLCGPDEPRCPEGYTPTNVNSRCECHRTPDGTNPAPITPAACTVDQIEGNDTTQSATPTAIGQGGTNTTSFASTSICPATDKDYFAVNLVCVSAILRVDLQYEVGKPPPRIDILNAFGVSLTPTIAANAQGKITATATGSQSGQHYVLVESGPNGMPQNYMIDIVVTPPRPTGCI